MARTGITYLEVAAAIDKIIASGEEPTIQKIRDTLGTGSPNTIHRHLTEWRAARPVEQRKTVELPVDLAAALLKEIERQAADARSEVEKHLIAAQAEAAELSKIGEGIESDLESAREELELKDAERLKIKADFDRQTDSLANTQRDLAAERALVNEMRDELALTKNRVITLSEQVDHLKSELTVAKTDLKSAHDAQVQAEKAAAVAAAQLASEQQKATDLISRLTAANEAIATLKADHKSEIEVMRKEVNQARTEMIKAHATLEVMRDKASADTKKLNEQLALEHRKNAELQSDIDSLNDKLTAQSQAKK